MDKPMIGIRQADGSFYEIMDEAQGGHKRMVLSAARTDQRGVRIDLYRSADGNLEGSEALGEIAIDDPEGLGYQDIEFHLDLDAEGKLTASAALPGQPPQTLSVDLGAPAEARGDREILNDDSLDLADIDVLADDFNPEAEVEPMTLDFPEVGDPEGETPRRSDNAILDDEALADVELDSLDDFGLDEEAPALVADPDLDDEFSMDDLDPEPMALETPQAAESFDLGDLDAGFGDDASPEVEAIEDWEKISLDDMEPMEFMDTGAEISRPSEKKSPASPSSSPQPSKAAKSDDFSMEDDEPLELADFDSDSDFTDLSSLDSDDGLDHDFMAPPELTEPEPWEASSTKPVAEKPSKQNKAAKPPKPSKPAKVAQPVVRESGGGLDKAALFLSLTALSLLVILVLVLLFLNMVKPAPVPAIQPEVMRWKPSSSVEPMATGSNPSDIDLGSPNAPHFEAASILEVPTALRGARVSLRLRDGESPQDASDRFGTPARREGALLSW